MIILDEISFTLGINKEHLLHLFTIPEKFYFTYSKKKANGTRRIINAPSPEIKAIQAYILRTYLENISISQYAHGFKIGKGIRSNAQMHMTKKYILSIDIKEFFPSISSFMIKGVFKSLPGIDGESAELLTKICTFEEKLPQGGVTSPYLSNIIFKEIDETIARSCNIEGIVYTRYADDLTFSHDDIDKLILIFKKVEPIINTAGFVLNPKKTRILSGKNRKAVTGVILNEKGRMTVGRKRKRLLRSIMHHYIVKKDSKVNLKFVIGNLAFINDIEGDYSRKFFEYCKAIKNKNI